MKVVGHMDSACEEAIRTWIAAIEAERPNPADAAAAAQKAARCLDDAPQMTQFRRALQSEQEDSLSCEECQVQLPDLIYAQIESTQAQGKNPVSPNNQNVLAHLALCPHCATAYAEVTEMLLASEMDAVPTAAVYPAFEVPLARPKNAMPPPAVWGMDTRLLRVKNGPKMLWGVSIYYWHKLSRRSQKPPGR